MPFSLCTVVTVFTTRACVLNRKSMRSYRAFQLLPVALLLTRPCAVHAYCGVISSRSQRFSQKHTTGMFIKDVILKMLCIHMEKGGHVSVAQQDKLINSLGLISWRHPTTAKCPVMYGDRRLCLSLKKSCLTFTVLFSPSCHTYPIVMTLRAR